MVQTFRLNINKWFKYEKDPIDQPCEHGSCNVYLKK